MLPSYPWFSSQPGSWAWLPGMYSSPGNRTHGLCLDPASSEQHVIAATASWPQTGFWTCAPREVTCHDPPWLQERLRFCSVRCVCVVTSSFRQVATGCWLELLCPLYLVKRHVSILSRRVQWVVCKCGHPVHCTHRAGTRGGAQLALTKGTTFKRVPKTLR